MLNNIMNIVLYCFIHLFYHNNFPQSLCYSLKDLCHRFLITVNISVSFSVHNLYICGTCIAALFEEHRRFPIILPICFVTNAFRTLVTDINKIIWKILFC